VLDVPVNEAKDMMLFFHRCIIHRARAVYLYTMPDNFLMHLTCKLLLSIKLSVGQIAVITDERSPVLDMVKISPAIIHLFEYS